MLSIALLSGLGQSHGAGPMPTCWGQRGCKHAVSPAGGTTDLRINPVSNRSFTLVVGSTTTPLRDWHLNFSVWEGVEVNLLFAAWS